MPFIEFTACLLGLYSAAALLTTDIKARQITVITPMGALMFVGFASILIKLWGLF